MTQLLRRLEPLATPRQRVSKRRLGAFAIPGTSLRTGQPHAQTAHTRTNPKRLDTIFLFIRLEELARPKKEREIFCVTKLCVCTKRQSYYTLRPADTLTREPFCALSTETRRRVEASTRSAACRDRERGAHIDGSSPSNQNSSRSEGEHMRRISPTQL